MDKIKMLINDNWKFKLSDEKEAFWKEFDDSSFKTVTIPHDWSVEYPLSREFSSGTGYVRGGTAWYRKEFYLPKEYIGKKIFIEFEGVYKNSHVWCNGYFKGKRPNGYVSFRYDITDNVKFGDEKNVISVKVIHEDIADSRWFTGSGINRNVSIIIDNDVYLDEYGVFFTTPSVSNEAADIKIDNEIIVEGTCEKICVKNILRDNAGNIVFEEETIIDSIEDKKVLVTNVGKIQAPNLWSIENPNLYELSTYINSGQEYMLSDVMKVGIRKVEFTPDNGFKLNDKSIKIKGVCIHHDGGSLGSAVSKEVWRRRFLKLKDMGCNSIRTSHNPHAKAIYELSDELGFLVMDEAFDEWEAPKNKWFVGHNVYPPKHEGYAEDFLLYHEMDLTSLIRRDRNHPSVILWSVGNEIDYPNDPYCHESFELMTGNNDADKPLEERKFKSTRPNMKRLSVIAKNLHEIAKKSDTTRFITVAAAFPELSADIGFIDSFTLVGYNYRENLYERDHLIFPEKIFLGSENGHGYKEWKIVRDTEYISSQYLWTGIDYLGECKGWPVHGYTNALITTAGFEKPEFYRRKSFWSEEKMVRIMTSRDIDNKDEFKKMNESYNYIIDELIEVRIYTNDSDIKLYQNDEEIITKFNTSLEEDGYLSCFINFKPGKLTAKTDHASHTLETVFAPAYLEANSIIAEDIIQVEVFVKDMEGRDVRGDRSKIKVNVSGDGEFISMDNGDLADLTDYTYNERCANDGKLIIYVRKKGDKELNLVISSPMLKGVNLSF